MAAGAVRAILFGRLEVLAVLLCGLLLVPGGLAPRTALARKRWTIETPLGAFNLAFGMARAAYVLDLKNWRGGGRASREKKSESSGDSARSGANRSGE